MRAAALVLVLSLGGAALADAPSQSLRPIARAGVVDIAPPAVAQGGLRGLFRSLRPQPRSARVEGQARATRAALQRGAVCGDPDLQGEAVGPVSGQMRGCGIDQAVRLKSVAGVRLSAPAKMDCGTAKALKTWVERGMRPAVGSHGGGVDSIRVMASYACRTRNSQKGARISEHGKGRAVDIGGFALRNGTEISVLQDWGRGREGRILRKMHRSAC